MSTLAEIEAAVPSLTPQELERLEALLRELRHQRKAPASVPTNLANFAGALRLSEDPIAFQHRVRDEWR
jgi:hypothetical protein